MPAGTDRAVRFRRKGQDIPRAERDAALAGLKDGGRKGRGWMTQEKACRRLHREKEGKPTLGLRC